MKDLYQSERLSYRAIDSEKDEKLFNSIRKDPFIVQLSNLNLPVPPNSNHAKEDIKYAIEKPLLCVVICIKNQKDQIVISTEEDQEDIPIGVFYITQRGPGSWHHRQVEIGITMLQGHQGKGYGSEAILWGTDWSFKVAGMHRVEVKCFGFNKRALYLYERLGFKLEGRGREAFWHDGQFWDDVQFGMLDREWDEIIKKKGSM